MQMMRFMLGAALLGAALPCARAQAPADLPDTVARVLRTVVQVAAVRPRLSGSGIVIGGGYVLTAAPLFEAGDSVTVRLADGRSLAAEIVGRDRRSGVALLKIPAAGATSAVPGDPKKLRLAERVFALGATPGGRSASVTDGIVSALEVEEGEAASYIQTTVTLHPAMGGGALFNMKGELVGINAMLSTRVTGAGLAFAIPIDEAMAVANELRAHGRVRRGALGTMAQDVTPQAAASHGEDAPAGVLIASVSPRGAAERAGIQRGDVVVRYGGEAVRSHSQLVRLLARSRPGERVQVGVRRAKDMREQELTVTLDEAPE